MKDPIVYILSCLVINFACVIVTKAYYSRRGDRRKGNNDLEEQVRELTHYVKTEVHTSAQVEELEHRFEERFDRMQTQVEFVRKVIKTLIDAEGK